MYSLNTVYLRPATLAEACKALAAHPLTVLAGGTDHFPARIGLAPREDILDITALGELRGIVRTDGGWRIGAMTTWTDLLEAQLPPMFDVLRLAAREVGGMQIQNAGTVAGNICNASPAADGIPALLALDASVELSSATGRRTLPLAAFVVGPGKTLREPHELVSGLLVPELRHAARGHFLKLGARKYLVISIVMVAVVLEIEAGVVRAARIAVGACSPVAQRLPDLEKAVVGSRIGASLGDCARREHLRALAPIDDVRASAEYRRDAALTLVRRALTYLGTTA